MTPNLSSVSTIFKSRLGRHMLGVLIIVLTASSLLFLAVFVTAYRNRLVDEHARASMQVNKLLEAALKNAMLKRDIPGLRGILSELGRQQDIAAVYILNPLGEVRFSTVPSREGETLPVSVDTRQTEPQVMTDAVNREVLRTVNPVHNEPRCHECHGDVSTHPVNGILVVDYEAGGVRREAMRSAAIMAGSGGLVLLAALSAIALLLNRRILRPLALVTEASARFSTGDLDTRVVPTGNDEVTDLSHRFNSMADGISHMLQAQKVNEAFLQRVLDAMPDGVRVIGRDYRIVKVNEAYCRQLGVTPGDCIGTYCYESSHRLSAPCSPKLVTCPLEDLKAGRSSLKCRHRHLRADGGELFVEVSAAKAMLERDGQMEDCIIESIRDQAEQAEASHQHRLSEIGQIAAGLAHEIHNPLSSIRLALTAIQSDIPPEDAKDGIASYVDIANREINRCLEVTGRLLRISAPATDEMTLIEVPNIIGDVVALVGYQAERAGVAITIESAGSPRVIANESDLGIVTLNVVQNAIHAMPQGGRLSIHVSADGRNVTITFADTGVGIASEDLHRIFWPFWSRRADGSVGSGLGLSICRAAIDRMKGQFAIKSEVGRGTIITVTLPDADRPEDPA